MAENKPAVGSWLGPWSGLVHCGKCHALMSKIQCPICGHQLVGRLDPVIDAEGNCRNVCSYTYEGALSWTAHSLLQLMQREWERPHLNEDQRFSVLAGKSSQRVLVVILFWTLFEHLMDQFFRTAVSSLPAGVGADLLKRYQSIGSRTDRLYTLLFNATMSNDLEALGFGRTYSHLKKIQDRRNDYIHGNAEAIDDELVKDTVEHLNEVQAAWVALFNKRCTGNPNATPLWLDAKARSLRG